ncbi:MAG: deoxyribodipyrimidine photo-lyase [Candidatus Sumerlaeia bacterium]|nr:deoxyribodipyrimidine photo-lyase [Candidatus Sumerlaeia bacterium]
MSAVPDVVLYWLRSDLRLHDNEALAWAAAHGAAVLPVTCFDPRQFGRTALGFPATGPFRARFLIESVADLRSSLEELGSGLAVRTGLPEQVLPVLAAECGAHLVVAQQEPAPADAAIEEAVRAELDADGRELRLFWGSTVVHRDDRSAVGVDDFRVRPPLSVPRAFPPLPNVPLGRMPALGDFGLHAPELDRRAALEPRGGEAAGFQRLVAWMWTSNALGAYADPPTPERPTPEPSRLSPWLAHGCLSPRFVHAQVLEYERRRVRNAGTRAFVAALLARDACRWAALDGRLPALESPAASPAERRRLDAWRTGRTGLPFADAALRELRLTGLLGHDARRDVAHQLVHDLALDWRLGAAWFASQLLDHDACISTAHWMAAAGLPDGPLAPEPRLDPLAAGRHLDPTGATIRRWLPRLAPLPDATIHDPRPSQTPSGEWVERTM